MDEEKYLEQEALFEMYKEALKGCNWMVPQFTPEGDINSAYAFAVKMINV